MFSFNTLIIALAVQSAQAHWFLKCVTKPGETCDKTVEKRHPYMDGYVDEPSTPDWPRTNPLDALTDAKMTCGVSGLPTKGSDFLQVEAGTDLSAWFAHNAMDDNFDRSMNANHHGFTQVYLTPFKSPDKWTKIFTAGLLTIEDTYNGENVKAWWDNPANTIDQDPYAGWWAGDQLRKDGGALKFKIPEGTPPGQYILRAEIITNWLMSTAIKHAQGYLGCIRLQVGTGSDESASLGTLAAKNTISIPQAYEGNGYVLDYNIFADRGKTPQETPGGPAWTGSSAGGSTTPAKDDTSSVSAGASSTTAPQGASTGTPTGGYTSAVVSAAPVTTSSVAAEAPPADYSTGTEAAGDADPVVSDTPTTESETTPVVDASTTQTSGAATSGRPRNGKHWRNGRRFGPHTHPRRAI